MRTASRERLALASRKAADAVRVLLPPTYAA